MRPTPKASDFAWFRSDSLDQGAVHWSLSPLWNYVSQTLPLRI
jgi:hypothetical protein